MFSKQAQYEPADAYPTVPQRWRVEKKGRASQVSYSRLATSHIRIPNHPPSSRRSRFEDGMFSLDPGVAEHP